MRLVAGKKGTMVRARAKGVVDAGCRGEVFEELCGWEVAILVRLKAGRREGSRGKNRPATRV